MSGGYLQAWQDAWCARLIMTRSVVKGSPDAVAEMRPGTWGRKKCDEFRFLAWVSTAREPPDLGEGRKKNKNTERSSPTLQANRGNANDGFNSFGTKSSPRKARTPLLLRPPSRQRASLPDSLPAALVSCDQNTPVCNGRNKLVVAPPQVMLLGGSRACHDGARQTKIGSAGK
ncbi:hypothetical protein BJV74DRAFT_189561 [Russula compacta]|nr:hypothetical protein BJV74DRAFT_189561 [Russula compacta]